MKEKKEKYIKPAVRSIYVQVESSFVVNSGVIKSSSTTPTVTDWQQGDTSEGNLGIQD